MMFVREYARPALFSGATSLALLAGGSWAQEYPEPARITNVSDARPIAQGAVISEPVINEASLLRWKPKSSIAGKSAAITAHQDPFAATLGAPQAAPQAAVSPTSGWNKSRIDPHVLPAQMTYSDPASDPFGDRASQRGTRQMLTLQPAAPGAAAPPSRFEPLNPPADAPLVDPNAAPANPNAVPADPNAAPADPMMRPMPGVPTPNAPFGPSTLPDGGRPGPSVMPDPGIATNPDGTTAPCNRIYNDRDCCEVDRNIQAFRDRLRRDTIRNISLDITPPFVPDQPAEEVRALREDKLRLAGSREWRNRSGEVVATGSLADLSNGRAIIVDDSGAEIARIPLKSLADDELCFLTAWWRLPYEGMTSDEQFAGRNWLPGTFHWHASALCHKPLYFEEVQAERYGHVTGPFTQPVVSGAHFFLNIAALPYKMAINPPMECQYSLGYYRPGSCAPWHIPPVPLSLRAAIAEANFIVGGINVIP